MTASDVAYLLGDDGSRPCPRRTGACVAASRRRGCCCSGSVPVAAVLLATLGPHDVFSQIALFFSEDGGGDVRRRLCGAGLCRAAGGRDLSAGSRPGEMLDGLGMAETTPGPLIMVLQFVGFMAAFRDPGGLVPMLAGTLGGAARPPGSPSCPASCGSSSARPSSRRCAATRRCRRAVGDHGGRGRRDPEPRGLVRAARPVPPRSRSGRATACTSMCRSGRRSTPRPRADAGRDPGDLPVQGKDDPDACSLFPNRGTLVRGKRRSLTAAKVL